MKNKQIYFVEYYDEIIKFEGFDEMDNFVKDREEGEKFTVYFVQAVMGMTKK